MLLVIWFALIFFFFISNGKAIEPIWNITILVLNIYILLSLSFFIIIWHRNHYRKRSSISPMIIIISIIIPILLYSSLIIISYDVVTKGEKYKRFRSITLEICNKAQ